MAQPLRSIPFANLANRYVHFADDVLEAVNDRLLDQQLWKACRS